MTKKAKLIFTAIETLAVTLGLTLFGDGTGNAFLATAGLVTVLIFVETVVAFNAHKGRGLWHFSGLPLGPFVVSSVIEGVGWVFLFTGSVTGYFVFALTILVNHLLEAASFSGRDFKVSLNDVDGVLGFTGIEVLTGIVWLALVPSQPILAAAVLFAGLLTEHHEQGKFLSRPR